MRVALCLSGFARQLDKTAPSLKAAIIEPWNADVFVQTWDEVVQFDGKKSGGANTSQIQDLLQPKSLRVLKIDEYNERFEREKADMFLLPGPTFPVTGCPDPVLFRLKNTLSMHFMINGADNLRRDAEERDGFKYDMVIRARMDEVFFNPLYPPFAEKPEPKTIYTPDHSQWSAMCDQFACGDSESMSTYSDLYPNFQEVWTSRVFVPPHTFPLCGIPERLMLRYLRDLRGITLTTFPIHFRLERAA